MRHFDNELKMYANQGLRSALDWRSMGRDVATGASPRATVGTRPPVELFSRDQTQPRVAGERAGKAVAS